MCVLLVVAAVLGTYGAAAAEALPAADNAVMSRAPAEDNITSVAAAEPHRRAVMRRVAWASLLIILLLIIFVVVVMILSRRMRIRYLGWDRRITFSRLWDVWWQKSGNPPDEKDRPAKK